MALSFPALKGFLVLVKYPLIILSIALISASVEFYLQSDNSFSVPYAEKLAEIYRDSQGNSNEYLNTLHGRFSCCGVSKMRFNIDSDPTKFRVPAFDIAAEFPHSCCPSLDSFDRCTYTLIYWDTCDTKYTQRATIFNVVVTISLFASLIWKIILIRKYRQS